VFTTLIEHVFNGFPMRLEITIDSNITAVDDFHGANHQWACSQLIPQGTPLGEKVRRSAHFAERSFTRKHHGAPTVRPICGPTELIQPVISEEPVSLFWICPTILRRRLWA
jgi:hypothetical protein